MKKIIVALACLGMIVSLVGCGDAGSAYSSDYYSTVESDDESDIVYADPEIDSMEAIVEYNGPAESTFTVNGITRLDNSVYHVFEGAKTLSPFVEVGDVVVFGNYNQDSYSDDKEPIEWEVLKVENGQALLISRLSYKMYSGQVPISEYDGTWERSDLRGWLNNDFYNAAFSGDEKNRIIDTNVYTSYNSSSNLNSGNSTVDRVYILSYEEIVSYYGLDVHTNGGYQSFQLCIGATPQAYYEPYLYNEIGIESSLWWTRTPAEYNSIAETYNILCVNYGVINEAFHGEKPNSLGCGVRPVINVNL